MNTATLTFRDRFDQEFTRTVEHEDLDMFHAVLTGTIKGNLILGTVLINMERDAWV